VEKTVKSLVKGKKKFISCAHSRFLRNNSGTFVPIILICHAKAVTLWEIIDMSVRLVRDAE
jgi:hypothetical protein